MKNQMIIKKAENSVLTLILNRPEFRNAFNFELAEALAAALKEAHGEEKIRVVVLKGAGEAFSAGGDLKLFYQNLDTSYEAFQKVTGFLNEAIHQIRTMPKPVVAALTGPAYAAGLGVALACDLVVASHGSQLSPSFINVALAPNASTSYFFPRILGNHWAAEAFMRGRVFTASEALSLRMINHVWAEEVFEEELKNLVTDLANRPTATIGRIKKLLNSSYSQSWQEQLEMEKEEISQSSLSEDFKEGVKAFVEKLQPHFKGK